MVYEISYDLNKPGQDYPELYETIKGLGNWCHPVDSTWFVVSELTAEEVRDAIKSVVDSSDSVIVVRATTPGAWFGLSDNVSKWLRDNL